MGTTAKFLKLRSTASTIKLGQWHNGFSAVKKFAETNKVPLIAVWSNGDKCGNCIRFEESAMHSTFKTWQKDSKCAFWFAYYGDTSKDDKYEGTGFTWTRNDKTKQFPFVRIYWKQGKVDLVKTGNDLIGGNVTAAKGAANLVSYLKKALKGYEPEEEVVPTPTPEPQAYKVRLNEKVTVASINKILDAIDANGGYCPCQPKSDDSKCHCKDFLQDKKIGEPCICKIYVKQAK